MQLFGLDIRRDPSRLLGFQIAVAKALPSSGPLQSVHGSGGWWPVIREPFTGAWQRNKEVSRENVLTYSAVYSCITLIASDIAKLRLKLVEQDDDDIWSEIDSAAFSPVIRKPNRYQNRIQFFTQWMVSKLAAGNAYVLKGRDGRGLVTSLYVLDPYRCKPLVAPDGSVFYELRKDNLSGIEEETTVVPASEIIHDVMVPLYHPLCGVSPIVACWIAAQQGLSIQENSATFFNNRSLPGGILTAPGFITEENAIAYSKRWNENYGQGNNAGKVAVLGDGLEFKPIAMTAHDSQLIEQLKWTAEIVCSCFHVPPYMIGAAAAPSYNNIEALNQQYYTQCLQGLIESIELCLDEGLALDKVPSKTYGTEFDLEDLLRMDTATKIKSAVEGLKGIFTPNEARAKFDKKPLPGGDAVYLQQQNYSIEALNKRDQQDDPFAAKAPAPSGASDAPPDSSNDNSPEALSAVAQSARWIARDMFAAAADAA